MWAVLLLLGTLPQPDFVVHSQCHLIEKNNFYDGEGRLVFTQLIAWNQYPDGKLHVWFWKMFKDGTKNVTLIELRRGAEIWFDQDGQLVQIRSLSFLESWTQVDVEVLDRECIPQESRPKIR